MQEHIERLKEMHKHFSSEWEMDIAAGLGYAIDHAEAMLEKEKEVMCEFAEYTRKCGYLSDQRGLMTTEELYDETFNTKEK